MPTPSPMFSKCHSQPCLLLPHDLLSRFTRLREMRRISQFAIGPAIAVRIACASALHSFECILSERVDGI